MGFFWSRKTMTAGLIVEIFLLLMLQKQVCDAHFMWAHVVKNNTNSYNIGVEVMFSETPGIPDGHALVDMLNDDYSDSMTHMTHTCCCKAYDFSLHLVDGKVLEGNFFSEDNDPKHSMSNCSALASGHFDFGPYNPLGANDVQFTFNAQIYQHYSGYDDFFVKLMTEATYPSIVLRNCGGRSFDNNDVGEMSYQFAVGGFPKGILDVCLYYQGGIKIHCEIFQVNDKTKSNNISLSLITSTGGMPVIATREQPILIYAKANMTVVTEKSSITKNKEKHSSAQLLYATTSVFFEGLCQE